MAGLALAASFGAAIAAPTIPTPATTTQPWSWPQFKQSYGAIDTGGTLPYSSTGYDISNPGTPTRVKGTYLAFDYLLLTQGNTSTPAGEPPGSAIQSLEDGTELRSFLLGDYGSTEPPTGSNTFAALRDQSRCDDDRKDGAGRR
jgi:hypothetical protein